MRCTSLQEGGTPVMLPPRWRRLCLLVGAALMLSACTRYEARALPQTTGLAADVASLTVQKSQWSSARLQASAFDPSDGLDFTELAMLTVINNAQLKAKRAQLQVAQAQVFSAGLLPDPQVNASLDKPIGGGAGLVNAMGVGLSYDLMALITRSAHIETGQHEQAKIHLELLWQEWQAMQQVRLLAVRYHIEERQLDLLRDIQQRYRQRYTQSTRALEKADLTLAVNGTDLTALVDSISQVGRLEQNHNQTRHELNLMLGLAPQAQITVSALPAPTALDEDYLRGQLGSITDRRADLMALQAAYHAQESRVRAAVLAQFPAINLGFTRARDTGGIATAGFGVSVNLPIFSANRGAIAIERASRAQLQAEYQARLAQTATDVDRLLALHRIIEQQQRALHDYVPRLGVLVKRAAQAYRNGDMDALNYLNMESTWVGKRLEQLGLIQSRWENQIALETLLSLPALEPQPPAYQQ